MGLTVEEGSCFPELREATLSVLENVKVEIGLLFLVLGDVIIVIIETVLDSVFVFGHGNDHSDSQGHAVGGHGQDAHLEDRHPRGGDDGGNPSNGGAPHRRLLFLGAQRMLSGSEGPSCDIDKAQSIANICRTISMVILFMFAVEIMLK